MGKTIYAHAEICGQSCLREKSPAPDCNTRLAQVIILCRKPDANNFTERTKKRPKSFRMNKISKREKKKDSSEG